MNILIIHNYYNHQGGEDVVVEAEKRMLVSNGHNVILLTGHNKNLNNLFLARRLFYKNLNEIIRNNEIHIAHIHNIYHIIGNKIFSTLALNKIPIVHTLHNFRYLCPAGLFMDKNFDICEKCEKGSFIHCAIKKCYQKSYIKSAGMAILVKKGRKEVLKYVHNFILLNSFAKNKFIQYGFEEKKLSIKYNFIAESASSILSFKYGLYIGRLSPEKGLETLIKACNQINLPFKIAGSGESEYVKSLMNLANKNIEFIGQVRGEEKLNIIRNSMFFIISSLCYENFPITILEAYSQKKPVIASNIGGLPSIVKDGETGLLFEVGNFKSLEVAILKLMENKQYVEMGAKAYEFYVNNFTEKQNYTQLISIYQNAIEGIQK